MRRVGKGEDKRLTSCVLAGLPGGFSLLSGWKQAKEEATLQLALISSSEVCG